MGTVYEHSGNYDHSYVYDYSLQYVGDFGAASIAEAANSQDGIWQLGEDNFNADTYYGHLPDGTPVFDSGSGYVIYSNKSQIPDLTAQPITTDTTPAFCFTKGTRIASRAGETPVERLVIGDEVLNCAGQWVTVKWIGRQRRNPLFALAHDQLPVRIAAGALGNSTPVRDLYVSPDHAMLVEGCLVHAAALVNGRSIVQMTSWDGDVEYFHIETQAHELILAEGAAAETFIDNVSRQRFDNHAEYAALYPDAQPMTALDLPRVCYARQLPLRIARSLEGIADMLVGKSAIAA